MFYLHWNLKINGWKYVYELPFLLTKDSMFQWFQYKINHVMLGTHRLMFKMGIVDNENCSFCNHFSETILNLFWECRYSYQFWRALIKWLSEEFQNIFTNWSKTDILFWKLLELINICVQRVLNIVKKNVKCDIYTCFDYW